jgi:hypothetical protein
LKKNFGLALKAHREIGPLHSRISMHAQDYPETSGGETSQVSEKQIAPDGREN